MEERNRRPSKHDLEEDEFLEWVLKAADYVKSRAQLFIGGIVALVALVVIVNFVQGQKDEARERASALLFEATVAERSGQVDQAIRLAQQLVDDFGGTPAAGQGTVFLGNRFYTLGRYADAERLFRRYLDEYGDLAPLVFAARTGLAACREAQGDLAGAAQAYAAVADGSPGDPSSALALMDAARCWRMQGDAAQQRGALERVTREYASTPVAQRARQQLNLL